MITRYNVNFTDHMIEVDSEGRFVKYKDYEQAELLVDIKAEEIIQERMKAEREELASHREQVAILTGANEQLFAQLKDLKEGTDKTLAHQAQLIVAAKERLNLLGHAPMCDSRYKATTADGTTTQGRCDCGLDEWMSATGVKSG